MTDTSSLPRSLLHPRYWPTWAGLGLLWLASRLPMIWQVRLGKLLGNIIYRVARRRRHITEVNIRLCFPELSAAAQQRLVKRSIQANAIGLFETAFSWWGKDETLRPLLEHRGIELIEQKRALGRGVILVGAHYSTLDLGGRLLSLVADFDVTYREHNNPLMNHMIVHSRSHSFGNMIERNETRRLLRCLKQGRVVWYAPDQDYGRKHSVFAPFFGVQAATINATTRLAALNRSPLLFINHYRKADNSGYVVEISDPFAEFPTGNEVADATLINTAIEAAIRQHPEQYMWVHRRFKTRPPGEKKPY